MRKHLQAEPARDSRQPPAHSLTVVPAARSIYLVGMMGSGKSTVGRMLANTLKYAFFDTDNVIELAHNKQSVSELWKEHGEEYFRNCESQVSISSSVGR